MEMLKFHRLPAKGMLKRSVAQRLADFGEIERGFDAEQAAQQASRCSQCGIPFCSHGCPLGNHIPDWLAATAQQDTKRAYELLAETNSFPEFCGRICPQDRLCEGGCVVKPFGSVTIGSVERYLADQAWENGWVQPIRPANERTESVAVVGAGPAGLACAHLLRAQGVQVHIFDRNVSGGGLLTYGIPSFKLEKAQVARRLAWLQDGGVNFHYGVELGRDIHLSDLRQEHTAVLLASGTYAARTLGLALYSEMRDRLTSALDFLIAGDKPHGEVMTRGRDVVVIGGGDTAMDCVRTAVRQGAKSVRCFYRRDEQNMPGSAKELMHAREEGVHFEWLAAPVAVDWQDGRFHLEWARTRLESEGLHPASKYATGRKRPTLVPGQNFHAEADVVIEALGFEAENLPFDASHSELAINKDGTVWTQKDSCATSIPGVFAAGDVKRGASLVVWAIRDGRDAAGEIGRYLGEKIGKLN